MFNLVYKSVVVECSTGVEDLAKAIEKKSEEMLNKGYKLVTMSMVGTDTVSYTHLILPFPQRYRDVSENP